VNRRRCLAYLGTVCAAFASLATSDPAWELDDRVGPWNDTLSAASPEVVRHFGVESTEEHTLRVSGLLRWDPTPAAVVRISITKDDASPAMEAVYRADEADGTTTTVALGQHEECSAKPCQQGYSVRLRLEDGAPQEQVTFAWSASALMEGSGDSPPKGAYVKLTED